MTVRRTPNQYKSTDTTRTSAGVPRRVSFSVGLAGGAVGALLGGGTGVVTVPILDRLTSLRRGVIHGTANLVNVAVAVVGAAIYELRGGHLDATTGVGLMIGGVVGAFFGARIAAVASDQALRLAFAVVLAAAGIELCLGAAGIGPSSSSPLLSSGLRTDTSAVVVLTLAIGIVVGAWSAAMGLGGGSLTVPILILLFGVGSHTAEGTSLLVMLPNSIAASIQHLRQHTASPQLGGALACGATPGAVAGASIALVLSSTALDWVFGLFVLFVAGQQLHRVRTATSLPRGGRRSGVASWWPFQGQAEQAEDGSAQLARGKCRARSGYLIEQQPVQARGQPGGGRMRIGCPSLGEQARRGGAQSGTRGSQGAAQTWSTDGLQGELVAGDQSAAPGGQPARQHTGDDIRQQRKI
jgi:uncharacterized protein